MTYLMALASILLAMLLSTQWLWPSKPPVFKKPAAPNSQVASETTKLLAVLDDLDEYEIVKNKPLFIEGRQPLADLADASSAVAAPTTSAVSAKPPKIVIAAIIIAGSQSYALLRAKKKDEERKRLKVGDDVDGWIVKEIKTDGIVLVNGGQTESYDLRSSYAPVASPNKGRKDVKPDAKSKKRGKREARPRKKKNE